MTVSLSKRVQKVKPSATLAMTARAAKLKAEGKDIIALRRGEPDFDTPGHIAEAGIDAIRKGLTRYTTSTAPPSSRTRSSAKFKRDNGLSYERNADSGLLGREADMLQSVRCAIGPGR